MRQFLGDDFLGINLWNITEKVIQLKMILGNLEKTLPMQHWKCGNILSKPGKLHKTPNNKLTQAQTDTRYSI